MTFQELKKELVEDIGKVYMDEINKLKEVAYLMSVKSINAALLGMKNRPDRRKVLCRINCKKLVVLLQTDPTIDRPEKMKPTQSAEDRELILRSLKFVDDVKCYTTEEELYNILKEDFYDVNDFDDHEEIS